MRTIRVLVSDLCNEPPAKMPVNSSLELKFCVQLSASCKGYGALEAVLEDIRIVGVDDYQEQMLLDKLSTELVDELRWFGIDPELS